MFEKKSAQPEPFPKKAPATAVGASRSTISGTQPEPKIDAPATQPVSNLKSVFGFEKPAGSALPKVGVPPSKSGADSSWIKKDNKTNEDTKPINAAEHSSNVKPPGVVTSQNTNQTNPWKK
jgi:hypothetical protein